MKRTIIFIGLLLTAFFTYAQNTGFTQTIKGIVTDEQSGNMLENITVVIDNAGFKLTAITDTKGNFKIEHVPVGRQNIQLTAAGYEEVVIPNIEVTSSKEVVLEIRLKEKVKKLDNLVMIKKNIAAI